MKHAAKTNLLFIMGELAKHLLLAEDDQDDVVIFELAIKEVNKEYKIPVYMRHAKDGEVLFILLKESIPDILFLDINLPCKDGLSCIREIRKNKRYDGLPVIMYTAHKHENKIEEAFRNGANYYVVKSNTVPELAEKLKKICSMDWKNYLHYPPRDQFVMH